MLAWECGLGGYKKWGEGGHTLDSGLNPSDNFPKPSLIPCSPIHEFSPPVSISREDGRDVPSDLLHSRKRADLCRNAMWPLYQLTSTFRTGKLTWSVIGASVTDGVLGSEVTARTIFLHKFGLPTYCQPSFYHSFLIDDIDTVREWSDECRGGHRVGERRRTHFEITFHTQTGNMINSSPTGFESFKRPVLQPNSICLHVRSGPRTFVQSYKRCRVKWRERKGKRS